MKKSIGWFSLVGVLIAAVAYANVRETKNNTDIKFFTKRSGVITEANISINGATGNLVGDGSSLSGITTGQVGAEPANANIQSHIGSAANPHSVTKGQVGLGSVANKDLGLVDNQSKVTMFTSPAFTGDVTGPDGSPSVPGYNFVSGSNQGMYRCANGATCFSYAGAQRMEITTQVNMALLSVQGTTMCASSGAGGNRDIGSCSSSIRYKKDVEDLTDSEANLVYETRPVSFVWKGSGKRDYGFIAEETHELLPDLTTWGNNKDGDVVIDGFKYRHYTALLTKVVQRQKAKIDLMKEYICSKDDAPSELCEVN